MDGSKRTSGEVLEPPVPINNGRWSGGQVMSSSFNGQDMAGGMPYKSRHPSTEIINNNMSGMDFVMGSPHRNRHSSEGSMDMSYPPPSPSSVFQPDLVAIQVKRSSSGSGKYSKESKDMAGQTITYQSFQVPPGGQRLSDSSMDRETTPTGDMYQMSGSPVHVAPMAPKAIIKPQPVAKIVAKTRRSSRECSPDIIDIEKHEIEKNQDNCRSPTHNNFIQKSKSEVIYDTPRIHSPKSPIHQSHDYPHSPAKTLMGGPQVPSAHVSASEPIFITTQHHQDVLSQGSPQGSPGGKVKRVPPPPPPKRTNSIINKSDLGGLESPKPHHAPPVAPKTGLHTPQQVRKEEIKPPPQQQAFADCVQSLSQKFGRKRSESYNEGELGSSDSEDLPPPPPPIAMDIITPKLHNYGIPSKAEKTSMGSEYRHQSVAKHQEQQQQQHQSPAKLAEHSVQSSIHNNVHHQVQNNVVQQHQHNSSQNNGIQHQQQQQQIQQHIIVQHHRQNSNNGVKQIEEQSVSNRQEQNSVSPSKQVHTVAPSVSHHNTSSPSHVVSPKPEVKHKPKLVSNDENITVENTFGVKLRSSNPHQTVSVTATVAHPGPPKVAPKSPHVLQQVASQSVNGSVSQNSNVPPKQIHHMVKTVSQKQETVAVTTKPAHRPTSNGQTQHTMNSFQKPPHGAIGSAKDRRKDSSSSLDLNTSTTSIDSNTLPFANENVGTIKQRTPTSKPSIVLVSEDCDASGVNTVDLNSHLYGQGSYHGSMANTETVASGTRPVPSYQG